MSQKIDIFSIVKLNGKPTYKNLEINLGNEGDKLMKKIKKKSMFKKIIFWIFYCLFCCFIFSYSIKQIIYLTNQDAPPKVWIIDGIVYTEDELIRYSYNSEGEK